MWLLATDPWEGKTDRAMELLEFMAGDAEQTRFLVVFLVAWVCMLTGWVFLGVLTRGRRVNRAHLGDEGGRL